MGDEDRGKANTQAPALTQDQERVAFREMRTNERRVEIDHELSILETLESQIKHHIQLLELEEVALKTIISSEAEG